MDTDANTRGTEAGAAASDGTGTTQGTAPGILDTSDPDGHDDPAPLDGSALRRFGISVFIVMTLLAVLVCNLPASSIRNGLLPRALPYLNATGLDQQWGVFAPSVRPMSIFISARVERADGTVATYSIPYEAGLSAYWNYRWQKYAEQMSQGAATDRERSTYARWVADRDREAGGQPVRVTLVGHIVANLPPGPGPDTGPSRDTPFYTTRVGTP